MTDTIYYSTPKDVLFWTVVFIILIVSVSINGIWALAWYAYHRGKRPIHTFSYDKEARLNDESVRKYGYALGK